MRKAHPTFPFWFILRLDINKAAVKNKMLIFLLRVHTILVLLSFFFTGKVKEASLGQYMFFPNFLMFWIFMLFGKVEAQSIAYYVLIVLLVIYILSFLPIVLGYKNGKIKRKL